MYFSVRHENKYCHFYQRFGVYPDPDSESGSGSRRANMTHKSRKNFSKCMFWSVGWPLSWAAGFLCNLDIHYGGLGIGKLHFMIKKNLIFFQLQFFFQFLVIKAPYPRIGLQPQTLHPDPDQMNTDPKPWLLCCKKILVKVKIWQIN